MPRPAAARGWEGLGGSRALGHLDLQTLVSTKFCCLRPRSWGASRKYTDADTNPDLALRGWGPTGFRRSAQTWPCPSGMRLALGARRVRGDRYAGLSKPPPCSPHPLPRADILGRGWGTSSPSHAGARPASGRGGSEGPQRHPSGPSSLTPQPRDPNPSTRTGSCVPTTPTPCCNHGLGCWGLLWKRTHQAGGPPLTGRTSHALQRPYPRCTAQGHAAASQTQAGSSRQNWPGFQSQGHQSHGRPQKVPD